MQCAVARRRIARRRSCQRVKHVVQSVLICIVRDVGDHAVGDTVAIGIVPLDRIGHAVVVTVIVKIVGQVGAIGIGDSDRRIALGRVVGIVQTVTVVVVAAWCHVRCACLGFDVVDDTVVVRIHVARIDQAITVLITGAFLRVGQSIVVVVKISGIKHPVTIGILAHQNIVRSVHARAGGIHLIGVGHRQRIGQRGVHALIVVGAGTRRRNGRQRAAEHARARASFGQLNLLEFAGRGVHHRYHDAFGHTGDGVDVVVGHCDCDRFARSDFVYGVHGAVDPGDQRIIGRNDGRRRGLTGEAEHIGIDVADVAKARAAEIAPGVRIARHAAEQPVRHGGRAGRIGQNGHIVPVHQCGHDVACPVDKEDLQAVFGGSTAGFHIVGHEVVFAHTYRDLRVVGAVWQRIAIGVGAVPRYLIEPDHRRGENQKIAGIAKLTVTINVDEDRIGAFHIAGEFEKAGVLCAIGRRGRDTAVKSRIIDKAHVGDTGRIGRCRIPDRGNTGVDGELIGSRIADVRGRVTRIRCSHANLVGDDVVAKSGEVVQIEQPDKIAVRSTARHQRIVVGVGRVHLVKRACVVVPAKRPQPPRRHSGIRIGESVRSDADVEAREKAVGERGAGGVLKLDAMRPGGQRCIPEGRCKWRVHRIRAVHVAVGQCRERNRCIGRIEDLDLDIVGVGVSADRDVDDLTCGQNVDVLSRRSEVDRIAAALRPIDVQQTLSQPHLRRTLGMCPAGHNHCRANKPGTQRTALAQKESRNHKKPFPSRSRASDPRSGEAAHPYAEHQNLSTVRPEAGGTVCARLREANINTL